jgi:hypothetical protein
MTGVHLSPAEVRRVFRDSGKNGVRAMFLDLLIRQDFEEEGPASIPEGADAGPPVEVVGGSKAAQ